MKQNQLTSAQILSPITGEYLALLYLKMPALEFAWWNRSGRLGEVVKLGGFRALNAPNHQLEEGR